MWQLKTNAGTNIQTYFKNHLSIETIVFIFWSNRWLGYRNKVFSAVCSTVSFVMKKCHLPYGFYVMNNFAERKRHVKKEQQRTAQQPTKRFENRGSILENRFMLL